jgi:anthranilate phosphoribosyltransferase
MKHVGPTRVELGTRTIFNLLGPLSNPAGVKRQMVGVFARHWIEPLAKVLGTLGCEKAWVVHGSDGLDEITTTGPTHVAELSDGKVKTFDISPADAGLKSSKPGELKGGEAIYNAEALRAVLDGQMGPFREVAVFNAAAALLVAGKADNLKNAAGLASKSIESGAAKARLDKLVAISNAS